MASASNISFKNDFKRLWKTRIMCVFEKVCARGRLNVGEMLARGWHLFIVRHEPLGQLEFSAARDSSTTKNYLNSLIPVNVVVLSRSVRRSIAGLRNAYPPQVVPGKVLTIDFYLQVPSHFHSVLRARSVSLNLR